MGVILANRIAASDLFRWYGYRFIDIKPSAIVIGKPGGYHFWIDVGQEDFGVHVLGTDDPSLIATAKWIKGVLNGMKRDDEGNHHR